MSKALGFIIAAVQIGIGIATGNVALIVSGSLQLVGQTVSLLSGPAATKPQQTETAIKTERPVRLKGYGVTRRYGASILYEALNGTSLDVWAFHDGRARSILRTYLNDDQVTVAGNTVQTMPDKRYQSGHVKVGYTLGRPTETAFSAITALYPAWDASHRGDSVVTGYLIKEPEKERYFLETYPQGDSVNLSLVGEWTLTYDPRDPAQNPYNPESWTFSDNAVRAFIHYLMIERGKDWNTVFAPKLPLIIAAINDADTSYALAGGESEPKYRTALSYNATEEPANVIGSLLACFDGWYVFNEEGQLIVYSGKVYTPTVTIGPDHIVAFSHQHGVADEDFVNTIAIPYVSSLHDYNTVDGQPWVDEDDISTRGRERTAELGAVVPSHTQGRRLAKRRMARNNAADRGKVSTNFSGRIIEGERYINLDLTEGGATFFRGVAEITGVERDEMTGGYVFDWVSVDPNVDSWNAATEDGEGAPVGNRYAPGPVTNPVITSVEVDHTTDTGLGTPGVRLTISATGPDSAGLTWFVRTRPTGGSAWLEQEFPDLDPGAAVTLQTGFLPFGSVEVEVSYRAADGRLSEWVAPDDGPVDTGNVLPGVVTDLSVSADGIIVADWTAAPFAGRYLVEVIVE